MRNVQIVGLMLLSSLGAALATAGLICRSWWGHWGANDGAFVMVLFGGIFFLGAIMLNAVREDLR